MRLAPRSINRAGLLVGSNNITLARSRRLDHRQSDYAIRTRHLRTSHDRRTFLVAATTGLGALASVDADQPRAPGGERRSYGQRSRSERPQRELHESKTPGNGWSYTPLQDLYGTITPSALHFERHHAGVPHIESGAHTLLLHGAVDRPLVFTVADLQRLPSVSTVHFIECAGNSWNEHRGNPGPNPQRTHGLISCSEWTGVSLKLLLQEAGLEPEAKWVIAEGADACRLARSIPLDKAVDDVLVAYGQNGEALRPEQGHPVRLVVPGWEGNTWVKWLHRLQVSDHPSMHREESAYYTDLMPGGKARIFTFVMEAKSVITRPAGEQRLEGPGFHEITGIAWSGRGRITRVEVSTDGGRTWQDAALQDPILPKALTRFRFPWTWDGQVAILQSRCTDETGYVQPTRDRILAVRDIRGTDHYNGIKSWQVQADGSVISV
ncbi:MAG: sulfite dehydrogenase [Luteitalea sp.]|nr:sulfite dehydrogenase [Luteitalea sp.]